MRQALAGLGDILSGQMTAPANRQPKTTRHGKGDVPDVDRGKRLEGCDQTLLYPAHKERRLRLDIPCLP